MWNHDKVPTNKSRASLWNHSIEMDLFELAVGIAYMRSQNINDSLKSYFKN